MDHPVAVGTDYRQVIELETYRRIHLRKGYPMVDLAEVSPEIAVELCEIESTCFAFERTLFELDLGLLPFDVLPVPLRCQVEAPSLRSLRSQEGLIVDVK